MPASTWKELRDSLGHLAALVALLGGCFAVSWEVWPKIDRWQQQHLAQQLAERITQLPDDQVKLPLHELASLGTPALGSLVAAAASERDAVAHVAQQQIDIAFSACLAQLREQPHEQQAEMMIALVTALADNAERFGPSGQRWAERLTLRMIEVTDRLPVEPASHLLAATSRTLDAIPPRAPRLHSVEPTVELPPLENPKAADPPPVDIEALAAPSEQVLSAPAAEEPAAQPLAAVPADDPSEEESAKVPGEGWSPEWVGVRTICPAPLAGEASLSVQVRQRQPSAPLDVPTPLDFKHMFGDLRRLSTETLLERLPTADKFSAGAIRKVLAERGIDAAEAELTLRIESADEADRLRLVDQASQLPAAAARRLLRRLVSDPSGDVRLRALTTLATTNDPGLPELARTIAAEDKDPRVADLASRLLRQ